MQSATQPQSVLQPETGQSSTLSPAEEVLSEEMRLEEGVRRLGKMVGIRSLNRNLKTEDNLYHSDVELHQRELWGNQATDSGSDKVDEEMEVMAARDVYVNPKHDPQSQSQPTPPNRMSAWQKALIAGAIGTGMIGGGAGTLAVGAAGGYVLNKYLNPPAEKADDRFDLGLLPADTPEN